MEQIAPLGPVYQAGTLSGNPLAMRAGIETLKRLGSDDFYDSLERKAKTLADAMRQAFGRCRHSWPSRTRGIIAHPLFHGRPGGELCRRENGRYAPLRRLLSGNVAPENPLASVAIRGAICVRSAQRRGYTVHCRGLPRKPCGHPLVILFSLPRNFKKPCKQNLILIYRSSVILTASRRNALPSGDSVGTVLRAMEASLNRLGFAAAIRFLGPSSRHSFLGVPSCR